MWTVLSADTDLKPQIATTYNSYPGTVANRSTSPCSAQCGGSPATVLTGLLHPAMAADLDRKSSREQAC
ncbi:hypothetical protein Franean1_0438 [Parafrankia sp. EAN1pec]|nr:hypothetical protein Franean1_0438 [Frankia sp. EAN1pec]